MSRRSGRTQGSPTPPEPMEDDGGRPPTAEMTPPAGALWPPRWDLWPFRWDPWPIGTEASLRDAVLPVGALIPVEEEHGEGALVVRAELPGVDPHKDVDITVEDGILTIVAQRQERSQEQRGEGYRSEFRYGRLERRLRLPQGASVEDVSATYRDGVLEVRLPIPAERTGVHRVEVHRD
ncbi:Hsp20/alpha crystallin family protein [Puerhibacterium sp. TATVAM-FAB25]|uniref:Hsp20/alpha crystallin family protein n=1 Tax=Puerhibacterium sp. TATVAM-FAB25 TaxID=3093699 RepID=UPI003979BC55